MKKIVRFAVALVTIVTMTTTPVMAATIEPETIISTVRTVVLDTYDASVVARMAGRCGSTAPAGAKGIAFEVMYADKKNLANMLQKGLKTVQVKNSQATQVDLITVYDNGTKVAERMQLKDAMNSVDNIISRVKNGDYQQAQLVGTTETAEVYNVKAQAQGLTKVMKDSGISTEDTQRIANKALGNTQKASQIAKRVKSTAGFCFGVGAIINLSESIMEGDDAADTISNTLVGGLQSSASGTVAQVASEGAGALAVTAIGSTPVSLIIVPAGTFFLTNYLVDAALDGTAEISEENLSAVLHIAQDAAEEQAEYVIVAIDESGVIDKVASAASTAVDTTAKAATTTASAVAEGAVSIKDGLIKQ